MITSKFDDVDVKLLITNFPTSKVLHIVSTFPAIVRLDAAIDFSKASKHGAANVPIAYFT